jgi:hypothetical protein
MLGFVALLIEEDEPRPARFEVGGELALRHDHSDIRVSA